MKITICGSITNAKKIYDIEQQLIDKGHKVFSHELMHKYAQDDEEVKRYVQQDHAKLKQESDTFRWYYQAIKDSDAIVVCNYEKNNIPGYIGGSVLMEIGYAHCNNKKIFFMNPIPEVSFKDELIAVNPQIINNDLSQIK